jgi:hypothetical protein
VQKLQKKILFIGNGEGRKPLVEQNLFDVPKAPLQSGISLETRVLYSNNVRYDFWCVDSYELDSTHNPTSYYQDCAHVLIIPKNHDDLMLISARVKPYVPNQFITILLPSLDIIKPLWHYFKEPFAFVTTKMTERNYKATEIERGAFVENALKNASTTAETKPIIHVLNLFFHRVLPKDVSKKLIREYIIPTLLSTRI